MVQQSSGIPESQAGTSSKRATTFRAWYYSLILLYRSQRRQ